MATATKVGTTTVQEIDEWCDLVIAEFKEMPGLRLTATQAQRLWGLTESECEDILAKLVLNGLLSERFGKFFLAEDVNGMNGKGTEKVER